MTSKLSSSATSSFFRNILSFIVSIILESPRVCLFEKHNFQVSQKGLEFSEFEASLKYSDVDWQFNETTKLRCFLLFEREEAITIYKTDLPWFFTFEM